MIHIASKDYSARTVARGCKCSRALYYEDIHVASKLGSQLLHLQSTTESFTSGWPTPLLYCACVEESNDYILNLLGSQYDVTRRYTTLGLTFLSIKIVSLHRQECGCSSELLRCNASNTGIELKSIPAFQHNIIM